MNWRDDDRDLDGPPDKGKCPSCGREKTCTACTPAPDPRPEARDLTAGWQLYSRFQRWEKVTRAEQDNERYVTRVWTNKTGDGYCWTYLNWEKVNAHKPIPDADATPEVRVIESFRPDGPMYAVATLSTVARPDTHMPLVQANYLGRGQGWKVVYWKAGAELTVAENLSKSQARSMVRAAAREHARALKVKVVLPTKEPGR